MKGFFSAITRLSLRFYPITLLLSVLISIAGVVAVTQLRQELIPSVEFPQTIILAQATGMTSEQVLNVLTNRLESALNENVEEILNIESTTTGSFGSVLTAYNDFGLNQTRLRNEMQSVVNSVWLPLRRIAAPGGVDAEIFASERLAELTPDVLIYIAERDANFLFQLSPEVWTALSDETAQSLLVYLAAQQEETDTSNALRQLIEQEIAPALNNLPQVASVSISGGQQLPSDNVEATALPVNQTEARSLLLKLSPEVWQIASAKAGITNMLDQTAVDTLLTQTVEIPTSIPSLPTGWQMDSFKDATDLIEMRTLTRTVGAVLNSFVTSGQIEGALGQTDDLTPDTITQMLAIEPTLIEYFDADQLAAMSDDVFAVLPDEFIAGLDGFTRDQLAAKALANAITGETAAATPVDLPNAWQIAPPQLITFSFDDLPLATFSIAATGEIDTQAVSASTDITTGTTPEGAAETTAPNIAAQNIPEGPELPPLFGILGASFGVEIDSADDLIGLELPETAAAQFGATSLPPAQLFNFLALLANPDSLPEGFPALPIRIDPAAIIESMNPEVFTFIAQYDAEFLPALSSQIYDWMSDETLAIPEIAPPLDQVWNALASQPQFADARLNNARDVITLGNGSAATVLNTINDSVPDRFAGYDVRIFDSLTPGTIRYFAQREPDFFTTLESAVLTKLSSATLAVLPESALTSLDAETAAQVTAIASGDAPSAVEQLASLYTSDVPPADPNAPVINAEWQFIGDFIGIELDSADDYFRFYPDNVPGFFNSLFDTAQGVAFAPGLFGGWTPEVAAYIQTRDAEIWNNTRTEALLLMPENVVAVLPSDIQERLTSGAQPFVPTDPITRTDGASSMLVTIFKTDDANTVEAFHISEDIMERIDEENDNIDVAVGFEQASFIEESISGVAREGGLGAIFAIIVILVFLSGGATWRRGPRAIVGAVMAAIFLILLGLVVTSNASATGGDLSLAFDQTDVVVRVLLIGGIVIGLGIALLPVKLPRPAWRSTLVTAVSIPLSVLMALALMRWLPPAVHTALEPSADGSPLVTFLLRLFPASLTINIMTLSGLTVAIGRVVDDSIVVLENIFRQIQEGGDRRQAIIQGTRDVSVAIFAATVITVVVFLPLGLTGGIIGEFFLPFGLAVTYSLLASFVVAITVVPVVAFLLLDSSEVSHEHQQSWIERIYEPILRWALSGAGSRAIVLGIALFSLVLGGYLLSQRPQTFLPSFGEPQIAVAIELPAGTSILETNAQVEQFETYLESLSGEEVGRVQTLVGNAGATAQSLLLGGGGISENIASITVAVDGTPEQLDALTADIRAEAERQFGEENVTVSSASLSEQGFGGFAVVLAGPQEDLLAINQTIIDTLNGVEGLANVSSNLAGFGASTGANAPATYIRVNGQSAAQYTGELETQNTLGVTNDALDAVRALPELPASITVGQGFQSELQTAGFGSVIVAMGIAIVIVIAILIITFGSFLHWFDIILSIAVAPVGAAILLTIGDRVVGISALIGLLMLIGIVVTNAVVLIDRVQSNRRERNMTIKAALLEAGDRRLRPILMTAIATIGALVPLAIGLSEGAIIASELGTVVIGGLFSSTVLTLVVVPVMYSIIARLSGGDKKVVTTIDTTAPQGAD